MVKVNGPMMSLQASGTLADTITFSSWKGRPYVRERVIPSNPRTGAQVGRRAMFTFLTQIWDTLSAGQQATWQDLADQLVASPFNAFCGRNMQGWHNFLAPSRADPAARNGTIGATINGETAAWEENRIKITLHLAAVNDNWATEIFASLTAGFATAVGNAIMVQPMMTTDERNWYWTPPSVDTWYFNYRLSTFTGLLGGQEGQFLAVP